MLKHNPGEHATGTNRYTGDKVAGAVIAHERGFDGVDYVRIDQPGIGPQTIRRDDLIPPRTCRRLRPNLDANGYAAADTITCLSCGRLVWGYPDDRREWGTAWTHDYDSIPARFR